MSKDIEGLVETSTNLAAVKTSENDIIVTTSQRSSIEEELNDIVEKVRICFNQYYARTESDSYYPGWKPNPDSPITKKMFDLYKTQFGKEPKIYAIHAGLECGLLGGVYPNWDMISFGPTICFPHSPDEKVNVPSVQKFWDFLVETLKNVPIKG